MCFYWITTYNRYFYDGGSWQTRTADIYLVEVALYQLS